MDAGTALFKIHEPGKPVRRYEFRCGEQCAHRTLQRLHASLPDGGMVDMQWWDAEGNAAGGGGMGRFKNIVQVFPHLEWSQRIQVTPCATPVPASDDRVYRPFTASNKPLVLRP